MSLQFTVVLYNLRNTSLRQIQSFPCHECISVHTQNPRVTASQHMHQSNDGSLWSHYVLGGHELQNVFRSRMLLQ